MSRSPRSRNQTAITLFPFLAVLICTMGALIVLLVVVVQQAQQPASAQVEPVPPASVCRIIAPSPDEIHDEKIAAELDEAATRLNREVEDFQWASEQLVASRENTRQRLEDARLELSRFEDQTRSLEIQLELLEKQAADLLDTEENKLPADDNAATRLAQLRQEIESTKERLAEAREKAALGSRQYALIPYDGPFGTKRRPIYIECLAERVILQPHGVEFGPEDFLETGPGNPLAAALRAAREYLSSAGLTASKGEPYPLLVVRPQGAHSFSACRSALRSWDDEFGYELVPDEFELVYPPVDPALTRTLADSVHQARFIAGIQPPSRDGQEHVSLLAEAIGNQQSSDPSQSSADVDFHRDGQDPGHAAFRNLPAGEEKSNGTRGGLALNQTPGQGDAGGWDGGSGLGSGTATNPGGDSGIGTGHVIGNGNGSAPPPGLAGGLGSGDSPGDGSVGKRSNAGGLYDGIASPWIDPNDSLVGGNGGRQSVEHGSAGGGQHGDSQADISNRLGSTDILPYPGNAADLNGASGDPSGASPTASSAGDPMAGGHASRGGSAGGSSGTLSLPGSSAGMATSSAGTTGSPPPPMAGTNAMDGQPPAPSLSFSQLTSSEPPTDERPSRSIAATQGNNWALPNAAEGSIGITRPILLTCGPNEIVLMSETGTRRSENIPLDRGVAAAIQPLVSKIWTEIDAWGIAGHGVYWKPVLHVSVAPHAEQQFSEMATMLEGSGLEIRRR